MAGSEIKVMWERILNYTITEQKTSNIHEFLKAHGYSSSLIRAIKEDPEGIRLNGEPVLARTLLTPGDQLAIRITETKFSENIVPSDLPLSIVYEDPDLLVINKPAGMPIHPSQGNYDNTLANACAWYFKEKGEPFVYRCINRLDRDTTGLLIIARHLYSASLLSAMMARREIHREYLALATGIVPEDGIITAPIARKEGSTIEVIRFREIFSIIRITAISAIRHCTHIICVSGIQSQEKKCISQRLCLKICYSDKYI